MTPRFEVRFETKLDIVVEIEAADDERAELAAGEAAESWLSTVTGDGRDVRAAASLDGVGAYETTKLVRHGMLSGSHERPDGPECYCGAEWDWWNDRCTSTLPE